MDNMVGYQVDNFLMIPFHTFKLRNIAFDILEVVCSTRYRKGHINPDLIGPAKRDYLFL